jgi:hypothetical protein
MSLHIFICVDWFLFQEENDFKNYFENIFGKLEMKKEKERFSLLNFWPEGLAL